VNLAVFDLDNTLLAGDSDYLWGRFLVERGLADGIIYERENKRFYDEYLAGTLNIEEFAAFSLAPLAANDPAMLRAWRSDFVREKIEPIVAPGTKALLANHRAFGDTMIITTATNRFITEPIAALLGVENLLASEPEIIDGRYTGRLQGRANFREGKVEHLRNWIATHRIAYSRMSCYSDSHNDLPLLRMGDEAIAVDPDPVLRAEAEINGWPIVSLRGAPGGT